MRDRLIWLAVVVVAISTAIGVPLAFSAPIVPLPPPLTLSGPPPVEASPSVDFVVVPAPSVDLTHQDSTDQDKTGPPAPDADPSDDDDEVDAPDDGGDDGAND
jgi:hypothetical protein